MKRKTTPGISTGSMADIAFLLLIFFLVATTVQNESVLAKTLPPKTDQEPVEISEERVLFLSITNDKILSGEEELDLSEVDARVKDFYALEAILGKRESTYQNRTVINDGGKRHAARFFPQAKLMHNESFIICEFEPNVSFETFIEVQSTIESSMLQCRDQFSKKHFNKSMDEWSLESPEDRPYLECLKELFPKRYVETIQS